MLNVYTAKVAGTNGREVVKTMFEEVKTTIVFDFQKFDCGTGYFSATQPSNRNLQKV